MGGLPGIVAQSVDDAFNRKCSVLLPRFISLFISGHTLKKREFTKKHRAIVK